MLTDNGNKKAEFDVSKLTVFGVTVYSNFEEKYDVSQGVSQGVPQGESDVPQGVTNAPRNDTNDNPENAVVDASNGDGKQNGVTNDVPQDVPQGVTEETLDAWIKEQVKNNPKITTKDLAQKKGGFNDKTIKRHIKKLPYIKYIGSGYSGHWEVEG